MAGDGVPQARPSGPGETTGETAIAARHAAEATARTGKPPGEGWEEVTEPGWLDGDCPPDPDGDERDWPGPGELDQVVREAEAAQAEEDAAHARLVAAGLEFGYAHVPGAPAIPGVKAGPGGGFGQHEPLDVAAPDTALAMAADYAAGADRGFGGVCDDELFGILGARQRLEARQVWERLAAIAELIRRRPGRGVPVDAATRMPAVWDDGLAGELTLELAVSRRQAARLLALAWDLAVKLPRTSAMLRGGLIDEPKAAAVAAAFANLDLDQARAAEDLLYACDDLARRTLGTIRDRAARAAMEVDPDVARRRREEARKDARVEVQAEDSGNAFIAGRELPPDAVDAMDRALTRRARQLRKAGLAGTLDELRAHALLEPFGQAPGGTGRDGGTGGGAGPAGTGGTWTGSWAGGRCPACGSTGSRINLTVPLATLTGLAGKPGQLRGTGPVDADLAQEYAGRAARHPGTEFCITLTGPDGRAAAHACGKRRKPGKADSAGPPQATGPPTVTVTDPGPPGSYGTWRYQHGQRDLTFEFEDLAGPCDHRHQAHGHDPGKLLKHLTAVLNAECTHPACRRPEYQADYEHTTPWEQGGRTCLCEAGPACRADHQDKQRPGWKVEDMGSRGWFTWITPSGRKYTKGPAVYPV
jgi:hypothetical protein